jgi:hypothetical protein
MVEVAMAAMAEVVMVAMGGVEAAAGEVSDRQLVSYSNS